MAMKNDHRRATDKIRSESSGTLGVTRKSDETPDMIERYGFVSEHVFAPPRRWRFDWANVERKIAIEIEGGVWLHGRHNRGKGFINDMEKYNMAARMGWKVFRYTPEQFRRLEWMWIVEEFNYGVEK